MKQALSILVVSFLVSAAYGQEPGTQMPKEPTTQTPQEPLVKDFDTLDKDGDGYITRAEADNENVSYHFDAIDKTKNDVISREEFVNYIAEEDPSLGEQLPLADLPQAHLRERVQGDPKVVTNPELLPKINTAFEDLDGDDNRYLSREEVANEALHKHFSHIDGNNDGRIAEREYNDYLREYGTIVATEDVVEKLLR